MIKLGARDRAQLVVFAYQTGLVIPRAPRPGARPLTRVDLPPATPFLRILTVRQT